MIQVWGTEVNTLKELNARSVGAGRSVSSRNKDRGIWALRGATDQLPWRSRDSAEESPEA